MPVVPRTERRTIEVQDAPQARLPSLPESAPREAFGGGEQAIIEGANKLAETGSQIIQKFQQRADDSAIEGLDLEASKEQTRIEIAAKNLKGKDALGSSDYANKEWAKVGENLDKKASNGRQRAALQKLLLNRAANLDRTIQFHADAQIEAHEKVQGDTYLVALKDEAVRNRNDQVLFQEAMEKQAFTLERHLKRQGLGDPGIVEQKKRQLFGATGVEVIRAYVDSDDPYGDSKAKAFFEKHKDSFTEEDKAKAFKLVESGTLAGESQRKSDAIFGATKNLSSALEEAKKIEDPKLRDETTRRVKDLYAQKKLADDQRNDENHKLAGQIIDQYGNVDRIPRGIWDSFKVSEKESLKAYAKHRNEGTQPPANSQKYYDLRLLAANPATQSEFSKMSLDRLKGQVTDSELSKLTDLQAGIIKGDGKSAKEIGGIRTNKQIIDQTLAPLGITPKKDKERYAEFGRKLDELAADHEHETGKKPNRAEVQAMVDGLLLEGTTKKGTLFGIDALWPDTKKRAFELDPGESFVEGDKAAAEKVPAGERAKIVDYLKRNKLPINERNILKLFSLKVRNQ